MEFEELIQQLGGRLGVELTVDAEHACRIGVDDMFVTIQSVEEAGVVSLYADVGEAPPQGLEELLSAMMNANYLFQGTSGATLSRNPEDGHFVICRYDSLAYLDIDGFTTRLEQFVNVLETWRKLLADYRPAEKPAAAASVPEEDAPGAPGFSSPFMQV